MVKIFITEIIQALGVGTINEVVQVLRNFEEEAFQEEQEKEFVSEEQFHNLLKDIDFAVDVDWSESSYTADSTIVENTLMSNSSAQICTVSSSSLLSEGFHVKVSFLIYFNP